MAKNPSKKTPAKKTPAKSNLTDVAHESFLFGSSLDRMVDVLQTAVNVEKQDAKEVRTRFIVGRIASVIQRASLSADKLVEELEARAQATAMCGKCQPDRTPKAGQGKRTEAEHQMVRSADAWWSRVGRAAGVIKPRTMQPKTPAADKTPPKKDAKKDAPKVEKVKTPVAAMTQVQNLLHQLAAFCAKNGKLLPADVIGKCNSLAVEVDKLAKTETK